MNNLQMYLQRLEEQSSKQFDLSQDKDKAEFYELVNELAKTIVSTCIEAEIKLNIVPNGLAGCDISCKPRSIS
jgi:hypothetical protein